MKRLAGLALASLSLLSTSCCDPRKPRGATPAIAPGAVVALPVPDDAPVSFARARTRSRRIVVYLPPRCVDAEASFRAWAFDVTEEWSVLGLTGDVPCPGSRWMQYSPDAARVAARVDAALTAASAVSTIDRATLVLVGYSQGAARAEDLVQLDPARFSRVMLIGAPEAPQVSHLGRARAVATAAGERDRRDLMLLGTQALTRAGTPVKFFMFPGAEHGEFGPEGGRVMTEALAWLAATAP